MCNFDLIVKNVNELNSLTDYNESKIIGFTNNGAKFQTSDAVNLTLYANGIMLFNGPFRPFQDSLTKKFCIDIMDGYFPSELQTRYPDGVAFSLTDKRDTFFKQETNSVFKSKGYRLGSGRLPMNNEEQTPNTKSTNTESELDETKYKYIETKLAGNFFQFMSLYF